MENQSGYCGNCKQNIAVNSYLHIIHCKKNFKLCPYCEEPAPIDEIKYKEHLETMHTIEICDFCKKPFERWKLEKHQSDCPKKPLLCKFCNLNVPADFFKEHAEACWSRTEKCSTCAQYVKLKDIEYHEKTCKNPSMVGIDCKFCKEPYALHIIDTHESSCGNKTTRCPDCGELIKKYNNNNHSCKAKKDSDSVSIVRCISCNKKYPRTLLATHIKDCHVNTNNRNSSSVSERSGKAYGRDKNQEVPSRAPFNDNCHSQNSFPIELARNQAVELSPPVQKDLSDSEFNTIFNDGNSSIHKQCKRCLQYLIPQESRIHPEICPVRPVYCTFCQNRVPYNIIQPELHNCLQMPPGYHKSGSSAMDVLGRQEKNTAEYSSPSNSSWDSSKIQTKDCPLCSKNLPMDRFDEHVRACAKGEMYCYLCKKDYYGNMKEHFTKCPGKEPKKGKKKNEEKNEGFFSNLLKKGKKAYSSARYTEEKQPVIDGIPCEFCNEIYPFAEIAVHELGCLHEISQKEERMKNSVSMKKPKDEVLQASGYTPYDPSQYMITYSYENKDKEPRNRRFAEKSPKDVSSKYSSSSDPNRRIENSHNRQSDVNSDSFYEKHLIKDSYENEDKEPRNRRFAEKSPKDVSSKYFSSSDPNRRIENSHNRQSDANSDSFYEKHLIKDHERDISSEWSQKESIKAVEEGKKQEDVIFTYSSATKNKIPVQEKTFEQGARPKYQAGKYLSKTFSSNKGLNCFSDSDEEIDSCQNKEKYVNLENIRGLSSTASVYTDDHKLNAIGSEREKKKFCIESNNNNPCISNENGAIPKSSQQDESSCITNKKESFNSDTSEDVYLSCDEGEEISEGRQFNKNGKLLQNEEKGDKKLENFRIEKRSPSIEDLLQKHGIIDLENYLKKHKDANILKNGETDDRNCNREKRSLFSKEDGMQQHELSLKDFEKYSKEKQNCNNHIKDIDSITSKSSTNLSHKENHSLPPKYVMDTDGLESEADRKNEEMFARSLAATLVDMNDFEKYSKEKQKSDNHFKDIDSIRSKSSFISKYVMDIDDLESEADRKNEETFASESRIDKNPFDSMTNSQFSHEAVSSLPPYSSFDSDSTNHGGGDVKCEENLDAYLQFLGLSESVPDANYRLFESTQGSKALDPNSSYGCLENVKLGANNANAHTSKLTSVPQGPSVQIEELKGVSKNMPSYTSPFLLGNECEEGELVLSTQRSFPLQEERTREIDDKSRIEAKLQSQEEKDNELNRKIWGSWRSPRQNNSDD